MVFADRSSELKYGELLLTAGMDLPDGTSVLKSLVSPFTVIDSSDGFIKCSVERVATEIDASSILASLTYSMDPDRSICSIVNPT